MYKVELSLSQDKGETITKVNEVTFVGEYMIICLVDLKTRIVRHLSAIRSYTIELETIVPETVIAQPQSPATPSSEGEPSKEEGEGTDPSSNQVQP